MTTWRLRKRTLLLAVAGVLGITLSSGCSAVLDPPQLVLEPASQSGVVGESGQTTESLGASAPKASGAVAAPTKGALIGLFRPLAPFDMSAHEAYYAISTKRPAIVMWFQPWDPKGASEFDRAAAVSVFERQGIPLVTWEPWAPGVDSNFAVDPSNQRQYRLEAIIRGDYDEYIRRWARAIQDVQGPVMLRPMHEMNGNWYPWCGMANGNSPEEFKIAWRHVHDLFDEEGVTNVSWVWSINHASSPNTDENHYSVYYPGDEYVDWTSVSGFNWGTSRSNSEWKTFETIYEKPLSYLQTLGKPIVLSEFGTVSEGGDKAAWLLDAYERIRSRPEIKAVVYYDKDEVRPRDSQDWSIASTPDSAKAFAKAVESDHFIGAPAESFVEWQSKLGRDDWYLLKQYSPLY